MTRARQDSREPPETDNAGACFRLSGAQTVLLLAPFERFPATFYVIEDEVPSVEPIRGSGSKGDSYDNALAETVNGLYKTELIRAQGPWRTTDQVELATAAWVAWWNAERLHSACGDIPPTEFEAAYHHRFQAATQAA